MTPGRSDPNGPDRIRLGPGREFDLIRQFFEADAPLAAEGVRVGAGDDCAVVAGDGIAVSTDAFVEGVHFRRDWLAPEEIGYRAAAAALSDLAAMAARPIGVMVSALLPEADVPATAVAMVAGVRAAAGSVGAVVLGGDVSRSPVLALDVVALGEAARPVLRSGARPGDEVWVTGELGAAAAAVRAWTRGEEPPAAARRAFARPRPRIAEARWLAERGGVRAMIDLSDGLAGDAAHLAAASAVAVVLEPGAVPVHPAALEVAGDADAARVLALAGGEDYELCAAAPPGRLGPLAGAFRSEFDVGLVRVGWVESGAGVFVTRLDGGREPLRLAGYRHFEGGDG